MENTTPMTIFQRLSFYGKNYQSKIAFEYQQENQVVRVSFQQFFEDCCRAARLLKEKGIKNQAIAISGENTYSYVVLYFASMFNGNVVCPINPDFQINRILDILERRKPSLFLFDSNLFDSKQELGNSVHGKISIDAFFTESQKRNADFVEENVRPEDTCLNLLTSGTTGIPKIVQLNHYLFDNVLFPHAGGKLLLILPLHHLGGVFFTSLLLGNGETVCLSSFKEVVNDIALFHPDFLMIVPALLKTLMKLEKVGMVDLSGFKEIGSCAAPPDIDSMSFLQEKGVRVSNYYGSSEGGGAFSTADTEDAPIKSIGKGKLYFEIKISENGELLIKGKSLMNGYLDDEQATKEVLIDGWYHTGDVAKVDENGFFFITGRLRNVIILSNGENVSPEAIEVELSACKKILGSLVKQEEDYIAAEIYYGDEKDESIENEITVFMKAYNKKVASFYRIQKVYFRNTPFLLNSNGKIVR